MKWYPYWCGVLLALVPAAYAHSGTRTALQEDMICNLPSKVVQVIAASDNSGLHYTVVQRIKRTPFTIETVVPGFGPDGADTEVIAPPGWWTETSFDPASRQLHIAWYAPFGGKSGKRPPKRVDGFGIAHVQDEGADMTDNDDMARDIMKSVPFLVVFEDGRCGRVQSTSK